MRRRALLGAPLALLSGATLGAEPPQTIPVHALAAAPIVDGKLADWGKDGWAKVRIKPATDKAERARLKLDGEDRNFTGAITVELKAGVAGDRMFLAARWPDDAADADFKGWTWTGSRYIEGRKRDDMFAVRFHMDGEFDRSMLSSKSYRVDVWQWMAGRTNPAGLAEDYTHSFTTKPTESAAEFEVPGIGTVYIRRIRDEGGAIYKVVRPPRAKQADGYPSFELTGSASGSAADVAAKGAWSGGFWSLEFSRALDTGHADDLAFRPGQKVTGQIAVWNRSSDEHKSVSEPLTFDFSALK